MDLDSTPPSPPPSPAIVQEIDLKIAHHAQMIIYLKIERNRNQPISKLPLEVLCRVFEHSQRPCSDQYTQQELWWIALTHVCHHWRYAALSARVLWTRPPLQYEKWTSVFLERSHTAGLTLSICEGRDALRPEFLDTVLSHIPHTVVLTVHGVRKEAMQQLHGHLSGTSAPTLEVVHIDATSARDRSHFYDSAPHFSIPVTAFHGATRLRHLSLRYMDLQWNSPFLSSLTTLKLANISADARPMPMEFLSMLEQTPGMRELHLQHVLTRPQSSDYVPHFTRRIPLLSLETLDINGSTLSICAFLFSRIILSDGMKRLQFRELRYDFGASQQLSKFFVAVNEARDGQLLGSPVHASLRGNVSARRSAYGYRFSVITGRGAESKCMSSFGRGAHEELRSDKCALDFEIQMESPRPTATQPRGDVEDAIRVFSDTFHALTWDNLRALDMSWLTVSDHGFGNILATTFGTLPGLRAVVVGWSCGNHLLDALSINSDRDPALYPSSVTFPSLRHISFVDGIFAPVDVDAPSDRPVRLDAFRVIVRRQHPIPSNSHVQMDRLLDCLMDRYERGAEIHSVWISRRCERFSQKKLEQLKEVVLTVEWDLR